MELIVLGSGTGTPHPARKSAGYLVRTGSQTILVDSGPGTIHRLPRVGVNFERVQDVLYTHLHPDHFLDLASLLFAKRIPGTANAARLTIRGGPGLAELVAGLRALFHPWLEPAGYDLFLEEYSGPVALGSLRIEACPVPHHASSLAYRLEDPHGTSLVISGDTDESDDLVAVARNASLMVMECSFPEGGGGPGHLTPSKAGALARRAGVRRLLLTHFYPACDGKDILGPCSEGFGGEVLVAHDWMHLKVD